jgi:rRNA processing protein Gar1
MIPVYSSNPRRVGIIVAVHGPLDGPYTQAIWATLIYTNTSLASEPRRCCIYAAS